MCHNYIHPNRKRRHNKRSLTFVKYIITHTTLVVVVYDFRFKVLSWNWCLNLNGSHSTTLVVHPSVHHESGGSAFPSINIEKMGGGWIVKSKGSAKRDIFIFACFTWTTFFPNQIQMDKFGQKMIIWIFTPPNSRPSYAPLHGKGLQQVSWELKNAYSIRSGIREKSLIWTAM